VMACELAAERGHDVRPLHGAGRELAVRERKFGLNKRGARGRVVLKRGTIDTWKRQPVILLDPDEMKKLLPPPEPAVDDGADDAVSDAEAGGEE